jgi:DNA-binding MarR family transcriptional regulator
VPQLPLTALLIGAGAVAEDALRGTLAGSGLRPRHGRALLHIAETGSTTQRELGEALGVDASVLVGLLNDLESEGLIERRRDTADRRRHIVALTGRGDQEQAALHKQISVLEDGLLAGVAAADRPALRRALRAVWARGTLRPGPPAAPPSAG